MSLDHPVTEVTAPVAPVVEFSELWAHRDALRHVCRRMVGSAATAEDLVQDTYLRALKSRLEPRESMAPWLSTVARRCSIDELRARQRSTVVANPPEPAPSASDDPAHQVVNQEVVGKLRDALTALTARERRLLLRQVNLGMSVAELADEEETSTASVRSVLTRARQKLRRSLEGGGFLGGVGRLPDIVRDRWQRWAAQAEAALPLLTGTVWHVGQAVVALVVAVMASLVGGTLPSVDTSQKALVSSAADVAVTAGTPWAAARASLTADEGASAEASAALPADPAPTPLPPLPDVPVPPVPDGATTPEDINITSVAASASGALLAGGQSPAGPWVLYRSLDGGHSWQRLGEPSLLAPGRDGNPSGVRILMAPDYPTDPRVFVVTENGFLHRSDDGGKRFTLVGSARGAAALSPGFSTGDPRLFLSGPPPVVYRDGAVGVQPLAPVPPSAEKGGIAVARTYSTTGEVLVGGTVPLTGSHASTGAVFTCRNGACAQRAVLHGFPGEGSGGPNLLVSNSSPGVVFGWRSDFVFRSTDDGHTFSRFSLPGRIGVIGFTEGGGRILLLGTNSGSAPSALLSSTDGGSTWTWLGANTPLARGTETAAALPGGRIVAAPQHRRGILCSADGGLTWASRCPP